MSRPFRARALAAVLAIVAAGCQDYNFNPVGHCLLAPGSERFTLSNISSADVLFVVDDSGSMEAEQSRLAAAFGDFVENLTSTNFARAQAGLLPLDFHVAVTTSSVFFNTPPINPQTCRADCPGAQGQLVCCTAAGPVLGPKACQTSAECAGGTTCQTICNGLKGESYCCDATGAFPPAAVNAPVRCSVAGLPCGRLETHYAFGGVCNLPTSGVAIDGMPFPDGDLVGVVNTAAVTANPRVLHFDKRLYQTTESPPRNGQGFTRTQLETFFRENVVVGTCGSAQEQGFQASRRALERALSGTLKDTYTYDRAAGNDRNSTPSTTKSFTAPSGIPTATAPAAWPGPSSKLVLVWVGDEDDCSSPKDPSGGVLMNGKPWPEDACFLDKVDPAGEKRYAVSSFVDYFTGLGRPVGAAFVVSARSNSDRTSCSNETCVPGVCCDLTCATPNVCSDLPLNATCGGQAPGTRYVEAAALLKAKGADVVVGSVCSDFRPLLREVAEIVKPPQTLSLPTLPAESRIAILRIADSAGTTRTICGRPLPPRQPTNYTRQEAEATGADWWFVATGDPGPPFDPGGVATVAAPSTFVYINPKGSCIANPGETYSADYLGIVPSGGCQRTPATDPVGAVDCQAKLGGQVQDWECFIPPGLTTGTCTCKSEG